MEATMFHFSTVMLNLQLLKLFPSLLISPTTPRKLQSLQAINKVPRNWNLYSEQNDLGDCVVFEEGIFDDTVFGNDNLTIKTPKPRSDKRGIAITRENLVPDKWREARARVNVTNNERRRKVVKKRRDSLPLKNVGDAKKERRKIAMGSKVEKKGKMGKGLSPFSGVNIGEYKALKKAKLAQLKPLVLDNPSGFSVKEKEVLEPDLNGERVAPKNPTEVVYGKGLKDVMEFLNSGNYNPSAKITEGHQKLFTITKEEMILLNKRMPDLAAATSNKWLPLHTLAACGELYFIDSLLKHNVDVNAVDKDGLTALHKALGRRQAIIDYLLKNSANPFVQDKDGATLMHYAVQTASTETIKVLLRYNLDINLQDNDGWTPLHLAVQTQRTDLVRLLLITGADKTLRNKDGLTPLDLCLYSGQSIQTYELIKVFKQPQ
ncbi:hypothetical protein RJT34_06074 [Clitoria ternatea]|uniref:Ankyrin repeat domain-containing protein, chloroplastic n=1 Tax=Clitoria ternatea TaxID=43366 RepID=A0AAN9K3V9_CLITE